MKTALIILILLLISSLQVKAAYLYLYANPTVPVEGQPVEFHAYLSPPDNYEGRIIFRDLTLGIQLFESGPVGMKDGVSVVVFKDYTRRTVGQYEIQANFTGDSLSGSVVTSTFINVVVFQTHCQTSYCSTLGSICNNTYSSDGPIYLCDSTSYCVNGICQKRKNIGEECSSSSECTDTDNQGNIMYQSEIQCKEDSLGVKRCTFVGLGLDGDSCNSDADCEYGIQCDNSTHVCVGKQEGEPCNGDSMCAFGLFCNMTSEINTCTPLVPIGSPCNEGEKCDEYGQCIDGICAGMYSRDVGEACSPGAPICKTDLACNDELLRCEVASNVTVDDCNSTLYCRDNYGPEYECTCTEFKSGKAHCFTKKFGMSYIFSNKFDLQYWLLEMIKCSKDNKCIIGNMSPKSCLAKKCAQSFGCFANAYVDIIDNQFPQCFAKNNSIDCTPQYPSSSDIKSGCTMISPKTFLFTLTVVALLLFLFLQ